MSNAARSARRPFAGDKSNPPAQIIEPFAQIGRPVPGIDTTRARATHVYRDIEFRGALRPDHVPTMAGDDKSYGGYSAIGRLDAIGYLRGIR